MCKHIRVDRALKIEILLRTQCYRHSIDTKAGSERHWWYFLLNMYLDGGFYKLHLQQYTVKFRSLTFSLDTPVLHSSAPFSHSSPVNSHTLVKPGQLAFTILVSI